VRQFRALLEGAHKVAIERAFVANLHVGEREGKTKRNGFRERYAVTSQQLGIEDWVKRHYSCIGA
jgi:hypothetical protein